MIRLNPDEHLFHELLIDRLSMIKRNMESTLLPSNIELYMSQTIR